MSNQQSPPTETPIHGVNLGGWLMLERWITPGLFPAGLQDEYSLFAAADQPMRERLHEHYDSFITLDDFRWLKANGIDAVRIPVNHGIFGDIADYPETVRYLDRAFDWADQTGISVLIDLHTAAGSQNGRQESGRIGAVGWHKDQANIVGSLQVIRGLANRYGKRSCLLGIELLNEPSHKVPRRVLTRYYEAAYKLIRDEAGSKPWIVFSDGFRPRRFRRTLRAPEFTGTYIDTHHYQCFSWFDKRRTLVGHIAKALNKLPRVLRRMTRYHRVIVGEWSLALDPRSLHGLDTGQQRHAALAYGAAQQLAFRPAAAWFFWTYTMANSGNWNFRYLVESGRLRVRSE